MAEREIVLDTSYGPKKESAVVYGVFGVHSSEFGYSYTVTHIPTGRAIVFGAPSLSLGLKLARMLTRSGARWAFTKADRMPKRTESIGKSVVERWRQAWSSSR